MYQLNRVRDEVTTPLVPNLSRYEKLQLLKNYCAPLFLFANEATSIARISLMMVITYGSLYSRSFTSMHFLGGLGSSTFAAGSLALAFANITGYSLFSGLNMGVESICSQAIGAKRYNLFKATIRRGIILLLFTSLLVSLLWINIEKILEIFQQDKVLTSKAHTFLLYSLPDLITQSFLHPLRAYLRTQSKALPLTICTVIACALHYPITLLFVSCLGFGLKGIALSCIVSHFSLVTFLFIYITFFEEKLSNEDDVEDSEESYEDSVREWKKLLGLALPSCLSVCIEWWCYDIMIFLCGALKNPEPIVASMGVLLQITSLVYIFPHSLSFGVSTRVGNDLGSNQPQRARRAAIIGLRLSIALGVMALTFTVSIRNVWVTFFTKDDKVIKLTLMVLPIVGLCELGNCPQTTGCGILRGSARPMTGVIINFAAFYLVGMPVGIILVFRFGLGLKGLWLGMLAAQISCVIGMMMATCRTNWELEAERARELTTVDGGRSGDDVEDVEVLLGRNESLGVIEDFSV